MSKLNVLSLFDGISCGQQALKELGAPVGTYYSSEVDGYAVGITQYQHPKTVQLGDVTNWATWDIEWADIDLVIGGSPCQGFSFAGKQLNFADKRSALFFVFENILNHVKAHNPNVKFMLENVRMAKQSQDVITERLGVIPKLINSAKVSAQNRERLYWANWHIAPLEDRGIELKDVVLSGAYPVALHNLYGGFNEQAVRVFTGKSPTLRTAAGGGHIPSMVLERLAHSPQALEYMSRQVKGGRTHWDFKHHSDVRNPKSAAVVANFFKGVPYNVFKDWDVIRKFDPIECERLQTLPDNYTAYGVFNGKVKPISNTQRYKAIGNGWTVEVIKHIFNGILTVWKKVI